MAVNEELVTTKAKLASLREHVIDIGKALISTADDGITVDGGDSFTEVVSRRNRRQANISSRAPESDDIQSISVVIGAGRNVSNGNKQRVLMHGHQGWNVRHGLCHIYMIYVYIWVVHNFCLFCCLFIIVTTQFVALYEPCKPKPKPKPSTYDTRTTTPWQRSKFRYLDRSQSNKYAINVQIQTISVSK